jgi:CO/xanthine dehydrogenase Mo-binding subunit
MLCLHAQRENLLSGGDLRKVLENMSKAAIGRSVPRKEGRGKVTGDIQYVDDLTFSDLIYGAVVRSPVARGRIKAIHYEGDFPWDEIVKVTADDIPGENRQALILNDQPSLAKDQINHRQEPVVLLAHADKHMLAQAKEHVRIEVEPLPAIYTIEESLSGSEIIWGEDNILKEYRVKKGDTDSVWDTAHLIVEGEYRTGAQEQLYIETQGMVARASAEGGVTVWGSLQCPYYIQESLEVLFGLPAEKIRVVYAATGGGFGGKEEYPSVLAGHAALLALKSGKTVKIIYDRAEDMAVTTKRHPSLTHHKTAVDKDGKLLAMEVDFLLDGGAYATLTSVVLSRGTIHASGPYLCPNVSIRARAVATNLPPHGAFRGFGAPQSCFAIERHMNKVAAALSLSPEEFRRRNFIKQGQETATGQLIKENVNLDGLLDKALAEIGYKEKMERFAKENVGQRIKRGVGFTTFFHGAGFTGSGEKHLASEVAIEALDDGTVLVLSASTEIGQGANTVFSQIASDTLGIDYDKIEIATPDTAKVPNSGPTVASRTSMIVGNLVGAAAKDLLAELRSKVDLSGPYSQDEFAIAVSKYIKENGPLKVTSEYQHPPGINWDEERYQGDAYGTFAWAAYAAEVEIDTLTYVTEVKEFVAVQEIGKVLHPIMAEGQIEGGVAQGVGFAIYEKVVWQDGHMVNNQMTNYIMPTAADIPDIRVFFEEEPYAYGAAGAKGIGELPLDGSAPAVINAVENALGLNIDFIPMMPEDLFEAMENNGREN